MAYPADEFSKSTLPDPELNPLLNPLLAAHMGRWAEVYFTSPPEKREQAVADLLRELENGPSEKPASRIFENDSPKSIEVVREPDPAADLNEHFIRCGNCAHVYPQEQRFCGMCGAALLSSYEEHANRGARWSPEFPAETAEAEPILEAQSQDFDPSQAAKSFEHMVEPEHNFTGAGHGQPVEAVWPPMESDLPQFAREVEPTPYRYRLYVGVALAMLLAALLYMASRGSAAFSGAADSPPSRIMPAAQPSGAAAEQPGATSKRDVVPVEAAPAQKAEKPLQRAEADQRPVRQPVQTANSVRSNAQKQPWATRPAPRMVPVAADSAVSADLSGNEELATAERYLSASQGTARDSREAAQWLWKAVGKGNPSATIALSDLYLRGDGVSKNCDQARLLLDAAARKGAKGAGERLRNLQAFGCR